VFCSVQSEIVGVRVCILQCNVRVFVGVCVT